MKSIQTVSVQFLKPTLFCVSILFFQFLQSQTIVNVESTTITPQNFQLLLLENKAIQANDSINEEIIDLVKCHVTDSVLPKKNDHHRVFLLGWSISAFGGYNWRTVDLHKSKMVGTCWGHSRSSKAEFTEYDVNFDLYSRTDRYFQKTLKSFDLQKKIHRQDFRPSHHRNYDIYPFVRDSGKVNYRDFRMHCELTPPENFRDALHYSFYPTRPGPGLKDHPSFLEEHPTMGMYGAFCLDCNHSCHAEVHPYEWVWWMKLEQEINKVWYVGFFTEGSNRFKFWSHKPQTGTISIPFLFHVNEDKKEIKIDHLVYGKFESDTFKSRIKIPENNISTYKNNSEIMLRNGGKNLTQISLKYNTTLFTEGLKFWMNEVNYDEKNKLISGYFCFGTSVADLYNCKITFSEEPRSK